MTDNTPTPEERRLMEALGANPVPALTICTFYDFLGRFAVARLVEPTLDLLARPELVDAFGVQRVSAAQSTALVLFGKAALAACLRPPDGDDPRSREVRERFMPALQAMARAEVTQPVFGSDPREAATQLSVMWAAALGIADPRFIDVTWGVREALAGAGEGMLSGFVIAQGRMSEEDMLRNGLAYAMGLRPDLLEIAAQHAG